MKRKSTRELLNSLSLFKLLSFCCILILSSFVAFGQGTITGMVTGADDGSPLIAATVYVKGTTIGTVTDYNGDFTLPLREGTYTLQISYMGYDAHEEELTVADGQIIELNVTLPPITIMGEEAVITAQARGQLAAVNQQLRSNQIVNVVSKERIKELPDENAAQAISRLPGIHLDGSKVVVRGVTSKMNKVMINGVAIPSTEENNRASDLGFISANQLSGIEVFKTLTPDMDADAIGGVVNLTMAEAPSGFNYSVTAQGAYRAQEKVLGSYKLWLDISNRFLDNKIGVSFNANYEGYNGGVDQIRPGYAQLGSNDIGEAIMMFANVRVNDNIDRGKNIGSSLVLDYKFPRGKLVYTGMLNHSAKEDIDYSDLMGASNNWAQRFIELTHRSYPTLLLNNSIRYEHQISIVKVKASASAISLTREDDWNYFYRYTAGGAAFSLDSLTNDRRLTMEPWEMYKFQVPGAEDSWHMHSFDWRPRAYDESKILADIDLEIPVRITDNISTTFKLGGKYVQMKRNYDAQSARYGDDILPEAIQVPMQDYIMDVGQEDWRAALQFPIFNDPDYEPNNGGGFMNGHDWYGMEYVLNVDHHEEMAVNLMDYETLQKRPEQWRGDYWGGEDLLAGYVMAEIDLWKRLLIIPGVRYETVTNNYTAMKVSYVSKNAPAIEDTLTKPATHTHMLPHLHARVRLTDWMDIRFSYNNTLSRPDFNHAVPRVYYDVVATSGSAGNPYIKPARSENFDANFTIYSKKLGLFTIGGFMKTIEDVFYSQQTLIRNIPDTTIIAEFPIDQYPAMAGGDTEFYINNPYPASLKGLEVEWQSNLAWLPSPFNGIVLNVNYTKVWSETKYVQHRLLRVPIPTFPFVETVESDTFYVNRLLHQANDIANVSLGYDYKGFSARVSFRFQGNVISSISSRPESNSYTNNVYKFDFVAKQKIPVKFADLEVFFNAINFTNVPYQRYSIYPNLGETNTYTRYTGRQFQLGIRLTH